VPRGAPQPRRTWRRPDPDIFRTEILPSLKDIPIRELMNTTGLSNPYCAMIRRGAFTPHTRHWNPLRGLTSDNA